MIGRSQVSTATPETQTATPREPAIRLERVSKTYTAGGDRVIALDTVSLDIHRGEITLVLGPSGSGKTTLVQVASGLMRPDTGRVVIAGTEIRLNRDRVTSRLRNEQLGFVLQSPHFVPHLSVRENVELPMTIAGVRPRARRARSEECLALVGLEGTGRRRVGELSGGQRQRVSIARALTRQPGVLFADEPTGSLDRARGHEIVEFLTFLARSQGVGIVMVTHDETYIEIADRVVRMLDGVASEVPRAAW